MSKERIDSKQAQIRRKLVQSGIKKRDQFQEIIGNLIGQKFRLEADLEALRGKVLALEEKDALQDKRGRWDTYDEYLRHKQQLRRKYQQLRGWQQKSLRLVSKAEIDVQYRGYLDKCYSIEQQIQSVIKNLKDEKRANKRLRRSVREQRKQINQGNDAYTKMGNENQLLRKRIRRMKKLVESQLGRELQLQNYLLEMKERSKQRQQQFVKELRVKEAKQKKFIEESIINVDEQGSDLSSISDISKGEQSIIQKAQILQVEGRLNRQEKRIRTQVSVIQKKIKSAFPNQALRIKRQGSKLTYSRQLELLLQKNKVLVATLSDLDRQKIQILMKLREAKRGQGSPDNLQGQFEIKVDNSPTEKGLRRTNLSQDHTKTLKLSNREIILKPRTQSSSKSRRSNSNEHIYNLNIEIQTTNDEQTNILRKEWVGNLDQGSFTDRNILKEDKMSSIRSLYIYYSDRGLAAIRAVYNLSKGGEVESKISIPNSFLRDYCKVHAIETMRGDFIKYLKARYSRTGKRVTQIKVVTNRNLKLGFGDQKIPELQEKGEVDNEGSFVFDIGRDQFPVSILGAHTQKGPYWYLTAFGVEINDL